MSFHGRRVAMSVLLVTGCGPSTARPGSPRAGESAGLTLFVERCETCHEEEDEAEHRPQLIGATLGPQAANSALKMVLRGAMPPGDDRLSRSEALALGDWLCTGSGRGRGPCQALVENTRRFAPTAATFLTSAKRRSGRPAKDGFFLGEIQEHMRKSVAAQVLDPSMVTLATGLAFETCLPAKAAPAATTTAPAGVPSAASEPEDGEAFAACVDAYLDAMLTPIAPPPVQGP